MTLMIAAFFMACGDQGANNKPANAPANNANANAAPNTAATEADIKKLVGDMSAALGKNDADALAKLYSDNYVFVGPDGAVATKAERLASMKSGDTKFESVVYSDMTVRVNPENTGAVVVGKVTVKGKNLGKSADGEYRFTQVWSKGKDGWQVVSAQSTRIAAATLAKPEANKPAANTAANTAPTNKAANTAKSPPAPANK